MKKFLSLVLTLAMLCTAAAFAETADLAAEVFVTITDDTGAIVLAYVPVSVTDIDADNALTINDALYCAHVANHESGAEAYGSAMGEWGLSLTELWGVENGGSYGYYVNNASAMGLADPVKAGDHVKAFVYTDLTAWSDTYCFFDANAVEAAAGAEVALTLSAAGYDANWASITVPVAGATLTVNGEKTEIVTDAEGKAVLSFTEAGVYVISADSDTQNLVDPVCIVTVN